ncbi:hydrogenase maturation nickel metallochaperone HypA/HybF [Nocardia jinanensis]|uniref:Hydrogenase maturation factor HypA n=1 Tax=Nocardia jinanensis TaxID=382504 RepID=A0A917RVG0_9NOCA|nr:hydrogenase maturation nickel metallochaperone HypA [Nocardia jinanensis]GGL39626.1 hydrogenase nickel incorporation protein HypA [Nocardia jinanensis]
MHELAIAQSVIDAVCDHAAGRAVYHVTVDVGVLTAVVPDALRFAFEIAAEGTVADGANLDIRSVPGAAHCRDCGADFPVTDLLLLCPCASADVEIRGGRELRIRSMEVSRECAQPADVETTR